MSLTSLPQRISTWLREAAGRDIFPQRFIVGFSGGLDSTVLLHALAQQLPADSHLLALHIHHGMQTPADEWAVHCRDFCAERGLAFEQRAVVVENINDLGPEAAARQARYVAFEQCLEQDDLLLLAHHEQDQAETLLLQLLRGAGVSGLAAMPRVATFGPAWLMRPLLDVSKQQLQAYAREHALQWVDDPSNEDPQLGRVYLRREILPRLRERWPGVDTQLARSAAHAGSAKVLLTELAVDDLTSCESGHPQQLSISALQALTAERRTNALRYWLSSALGTAPSTAVLLRIEHDLLHPREDAEPRIELGDRQLRRYRDRLFLLPHFPKAPGDLRIDWDFQAELTLPDGCGRLRAEHDATLLPGQVQVAFPSGGERIRPMGSAHRRRLKQLFQESGVPPWVRRRMPLIYHGQHLVAVADRWISADVPEGAFSLHWLDAPPGWTG